MKPTCPKCGIEAKYIDSALVYGGKSYGMIWACQPCDTYVGVHKGTTTALGTLADRETRHWRKKAHAAFDPLWQGGSITRRAAYEEMQRRMCLSAHDAHISRMNALQCKQLVKAFTKGMVMAKPGVSTPRTDHSLPDCGCLHVAPWEHCAHTESM